MFCASGVIFDGTEGVGFYFHVPWSSGLVFMFCALRPVFDDIDNVESSFHVFAMFDLFSVVLRESNPVSMFCAS
jgi:hypothetical protein